MRIEFVPADGSPASSSPIAGPAAPAFRLVRHSRREAVFENLAHDSRSASSTAEAANASMRASKGGRPLHDWHYRAARLTPAARALATRMGGNMKPSRPAAALALASLAAPLAAHAPAPVPAPPRGARALVASDPKVAARLRAAGRGSRPASPARISPAPRWRSSRSAGGVARGFGHAMSSGAAGDAADPLFDLLDLQAVHLDGGDARARRRPARHRPADPGLCPLVQYPRRRRPDGPVTARAIMSHVAGLPREAEPYWTDIRFPDIATVRSASPSRETLPPLRASPIFEPRHGAARRACATSARITTLHPRPFPRAAGADATTTEIRSACAARARHRLRRAADRWRREAMPAYTLNALAPAAGFASTVEDLGRFASCSPAACRRRRRECAALSTLREMHRVH